MKRRYVFLVLFATLAVSGVIVAVIMAMFDNRDENDAMVVTWQEGTGQPLVAEGIVLSQGQPVAGRVLYIETGSGRNTVVTGTDGTFSVNVGELEVAALGVDGAGRIDWGLIVGPSLRDGARFRIELK